MDGKGQTLVYYFSLPEGWEPSWLQNPAALALAQRWVNDGREGDRCASHAAAQDYAKVRAGADAGSETQQAAHNAFWAPGIWNWKRMTGPAYHCALACGQAFISACEDAWCSSRMCWLP